MGETDNTAAYTAVRNMGPVLAVQSGRTSNTAFAGQQAYIGKADAVTMTMAATIPPTVMGAPKRDSLPSSTNFPSFVHASVMQG